MEEQNSQSRCSKAPALEGGEKVLSLHMVIKVVLLLFFTLYASYFYASIRPISYFEETTYHIAVLGVAIAIVFPQISNWLGEKLLSKKVVFIMLLLYGIAVAIAV